MGKPNFQHGDGGIPSYIGKDQVAFELLYAAIRNIERELSEFKTTQTNLTKDQNAKLEALASQITSLKINMATISVVGINDLNEMVGWYKRNKTTQAMIWPTIIGVIIGLMLLGLKAYIMGDEDHAQPKPTTSAVLPGSIPTTLREQ